MAAMPEKVADGNIKLAIEERLATMDDIAQVVAFLASEESRGANGNIFPACWSLSTVIKHSVLQRILVCMGPRQLSHKLAEIVSAGFT